jgi:hypothetical protein
VMAAEDAHQRLLEERREAARPEIERAIREASEGGGAAGGALE